MEHATSNVGPTAPQYGSRVHVSGCEQCVRTRGYRRSSVGWPTAREHHWVVDHMSAECPGLRASSETQELQPAFHELCQVVSGTWGTLSADILFDIRFNLHGSDASAAAFERLVNAASTCGTAELFATACSQYSSFGEVLRSDTVMAAQMVAAAELVNTKFGGLYRGRMDCIRATCCCIWLYIRYSTRRVVELYSRL